MIKSKETIDKLEKIKPGCFTKIAYQKAFMVDDISYVKITEAVVRLGVRYSHIKGLKKSSSAVEALPWGKWSKDSKYVIEHNGHAYLRVTLDPFNVSHKPFSAYGRLNEATGAFDWFDINTLDEASRDRIVGAGSSKPTQVITIKFDNILNIKQGGTQIW